MKWITSGGTRREAVGTGHLAAAVPMDHQHSKLFFLPCTACQQQCSPKLPVFSLCQRQCVKARTNYRQGENRCWKALNFSMRESAMPRGKKQTKSCKSNTDSIGSEQKLWAIMGSTCFIFSHLILRELGTEQQQTATLLCTTLLGCWKRHQNT